MNTRRRFSRLIAGICAGTAMPAFAQRSGYPARVVKIIVPYAAGGGPDVLTRAMAARLADVLGKPVVVQNIVGAGGIVAAQSVAQMAPDGYSVLLGASSHIVQKAMQPSVRFDPLKDFVHVVRIAFSPSILVVRSESPYRTVEDLVAAAKKAPGVLNYASGGVGSAAHLSGAAMALQAKIDVVHVPYKGSVEIVPSIIAGDTQFAFPIASTAIPQIRAGKVRALAVTSAQRMPDFPEVPTLVERFGTQDLVLDAWFGLWAPAGTPREAVEVLEGAVRETYADPALRARSESVGAQVSVSASPAEFTRFVEAETVKFGRLVEAARLSVGN